MTSTSAQHASRDGTVRKLTCAVALVLALSACASMEDGPRRGGPSPAVRNAQYRLHALGFYNGPPDGLWGPETQTAVDRFQHDRGIPITDRLDERTRTALKVAVSDGLRPRVVRELQDRLSKRDFYRGPIDGMWGPSTRAALQDFQRSRGLEVSGELTAATASALGFDPRDLRD